MNTSPSCPASGPSTGSASPDTLSAPSGAGPLDQVRPLAVVVRPATPADVPALHGLVLELAATAGGSHQVHAGPYDLNRALFGPSPSARCTVAEGPDGAVVGSATWFVTYSTWEGRSGIWLEDLVVRSQDRGRGVGRALVTALARRCVDEDLARLEWLVQDTNRVGIRFYDALGSRPVAGHTVRRLSGEALSGLGGGAQARDVAGTEPRTPGEVTE